MWIYPLNKEFIMKSSKELKRLARENLNGNYRIAMGALLITLVIPLIIEFPFSNLIIGESPSPIQYTIYYIAEILISILTGVLTIGQTYIHLAISRNQKVALNNVFICFKNQTDRYIIGYTIYFIVTLVASVPVFAAQYLYRKSTDTNTLLICLGLLLLGLLLQVIISLFYGLVFYVMLDQPDTRSLDCFKLSRKLMKKKKGKYFYIILSFIGFELFGILSFGIGLLWVEPYKQQTIACFYRNSIGELFSEYV